MFCALILVENDYVESYVESLAHVSSLVLDGDDRGMMFYENLVCESEFDHCDDVIAGSVAPFAPVFAVCARRHVAVHL